ncbi:Phosrestin-1 [Habropoda laboriosa]|uniref:Phosrestin-1 n=1 Tax=Habropoda laboriosa TaxID=597456 RepID=A0A0L7R5F4_9HYME|nr:Phosrestin-1 [Habropoda laboriosa]
MERTAGLSPGRLLERRVQGGVTRTPEEARRGLLGTSGGMERTPGLSTGRLERGEYREVTRTPEEARRGLLGTSGGMEKTAGLSAGRLPGEVRMDCPIIRVSLKYWERSVTALCVVFYCLLSLCGCKESKDMAEEERHAGPEANELPSDSTEHRVPLYPITMENKRCDEEDSTEEVAKQEGSKSETEDQAQRLQQTQSLPQLQPIDTQTDRKAETIGDSAADSISSQRKRKVTSKRTLPIVQPSSLAVLCWEVGRPSEWESTKPSCRTPLQHRRVRGLTPGSLSGGENGWTIRRSPLREESTGRLPGRLRKLGEDCLVLLVVWRERLDYPPVALREESTGKLPGRLRELGEDCLVLPVVWRERLDYPPVALREESTGRLPGRLRKLGEDCLVLLVVWRERLDYPPVAYQERCEWNARSYAYHLNIVIGEYESYTWVAPGMERTAELSNGRLPESRVQEAHRTPSHSNCYKSVYKKSSPNNKLTLYLASRDLIVSETKIDKLQGVLLVDPDYLQDKRVYGQITLNFRYGREDEEVMGLKFCNEAVMCLTQLYPPYSGADHQETTPLQEALIRRLGPNAHAFTMEITPLAPPSVQLVPAKEYNGSPIGTSYDVRAYVADRADDKLVRKTTVMMGIRVIQRTTKPPVPATGVYSVPVSASPSLSSRSQACKSRVTFAKYEITEDEARTPKKIPGTCTVQTTTKEYSPFKIRITSLSDRFSSVLRIADSVAEVSSLLSKAAEIKCRTGYGRTVRLAVSENGGPHAAVEKPFLLSDGRVGLEARLDRAMYAHGDSIAVHVSVNNNSSKTVRRIKVFIVQHVDVCMFSNGKFKNVVALLSSQEGCPIGPGGSLEKNYMLRPIKRSTKNWIALQDSYTKAGATLASTVMCPGNGPEDRNVFAIYVSYYVKVKLLISAMGGDVSLKLPFTLMYSNTDPDFVGFPSPIREAKVSGKTCEESTDNHEKQEDNGHKYKGSKLEPIKEKLKESRDLDVDLIEHYEESDST